MKTNTCTFLAALLLLGTTALHAAITIPGADGSDGALNITVDTVIDLSLAPTGLWDANNTANVGKGIYDPAKWAVVFKYSSVTVATGKTLTFKNHASRAPVVWLVNGNVTISGTVSLDGQAWQVPPLLAEPGPGGSRGAAGFYSIGAGASAGFGVGGGPTNATAIAPGAGFGGSYGLVGVGGSTIYGNPSLVPLIGGSGGGGAYNNVSAGGGAGGGALLIACANTLTVSGQLRANGGTGAVDGGTNYPRHQSGGGSGGGFRILTDTLAGSGNINALGGASNTSGNVGRNRLERVTNTNTLSVSPDPSIVDLPAATTALLWPPAASPEVRIVSIGGVNAPTDPRAGFGTIGADVALPTTASTTVIVETDNVEQASVVKVRCTPRSNANFTEVTAAYTSNPSGQIRRWTATFTGNINVGYSAMQVRVVRP